MEMFLNRDGLRYAGDILPAYRQPQGEVCIRLASDLCSQLSHRYVCIVQDISLFMVGRASISNFILIKSFIQSRQKYNFLGTESPPKLKFLSALAIKLTLSG